MPVITYVESNGEQHQLEVPEGVSLMQAAVDNALSGMVGECCGSLACATCHCYIDMAWLAKVGKPGEMENDMLACSPVETRANSRLACQIEISHALNGLVVYLPASQF